MPLIRRRRRKRLNSGSSTHEPILDSPDKLNLPDTRRPNWHSPREHRFLLFLYFKETQLEKMRIGQRVELEIDTFPNHKFYGHVDSLAPGSGNEFALLPPDNATGNFTKIVQRIPVKIVFDQDSMHGYEDLLAPGMSAVVTVTTK